MTYRELEPAPSTLLYVPRVFGYKIHNKHENRRRLAILAQEDDDEQKVQQQQQVRNLFLFLFFSCGACSA